MIESLIMVTSPEGIQFLEKIVLSDRRLTTKEIVAQNVFLKTRVFRILSKHFSRKKISAMWIPQILRAAQKQRLVKCCKQFF